jgi:hypothetical protein
VESLVWSWQPLDCLALCVFTAVLGGILGCSWDESDDCGRGQNSSGSCSWQPLDCLALCVFTAVLGGILGCSGDESDDCGRGQNSSGSCS